MLKRSILKLNSCYFPIGTCDWKDAIVNIFTSAVYPLDIHYVKNGDGSYDFNNVEFWQVIKNFKLWSELPIRPCDDFVHTANNVIRLPSVVVCSNYKKIKFPKVLFPSKRNIYKRDNFTCGYTGKKLAKHELSIDHIIPRSRGGQDIWENLITCDREINSNKGNKTLEECNLKLKTKPTRPKNGLVFESYREDWKTFIADI